MRRRGLTLLELVVVLTILVALATLIVPNISFLGQKSQAVTTQESMQRLQDLLVNRCTFPTWAARPTRPRRAIRTQTPISATMSAISWPASTTANVAVDLSTASLSSSSSASLERNPTHPQLRYLYVNPDTETMTWTAGATILTPRRWQGPYLEHTGGTYVVSSGTGTSATFTAEYGQTGDPSPLDGWGRPIVIQVPTGADPVTGEPGVNYARIVSAGPNGVVDTPEDVTMPTPDNSATGRGDDVILFLFHNDLYGSGVPSLGQ